MVTNYSLQCQNCGSTNPSNALFCVNCGKPLNQATQVPPNPSSYSPNQPSYSQPQYPQYQQISQGLPAPQSAQKSGMPTCAVILLVLLGFGVVLGVIGAVALVSVSTRSGVNIGNTLSYPPAAYVKDVVALKAGSDGITVYFILADSTGAMTRADGTATLTLTEKAYTSSTSTTLYRHSWPIKVSDFQETKVGLGSFEHEVVLCNIGRLTYDEFDRLPTEFSGTAAIEFKPTVGKTITGDTSVLWK